MKTVNVIIVVLLLCLGKFITAIYICLGFRLFYWFIVFLRQINDISVIYVTAQMCRRTEEEVVPTIGLVTQ